MRRSLDLRNGSSWIAVLLAAIGPLALVAPRGEAQTLPVPLPSLPVAPPSVPSAPSLPAPPSPPARPPVAPVPDAPALPAPALPTAPAPAPPPVASPVSPPQLPLPTAEAPLRPAPSVGDQPAGTAPILGGGGSSGAAGGGRAMHLLAAGGGALPARSAARLEAMSPAERRRFVERLWDRPLRGPALRRLRARLLEHWSCAGVLSARQRRALVMRAGLFGRRPASWRGVARRLGVAPLRAARLARSGVTRLGRAGTCIDAGGAAVGTSIYPLGAGGELPARRDGAATDPADPDVQGVLGAFRAEPDLRLDLLGGREDGAPRWLLAFLAVLLALLGALAVAARRGYVPPLLPARGFEPSSDKPLLFLDVDGVISLRLIPGFVPPGRWHELGLVKAYVSEQAGKHIRTLARHYEIVWATGWEQGANRYFRPLLGLDSDLHVLEFGLDAASGSSDWKIKEIDRAAGNRPVAWVDDGIMDRHERWARSRRAPTMLVKTDPYRGISEEDVGRLLGWARSLRTARDGRFARDERTARTAARR